MLLLVQMHLGVKNNRFQRQVVIEQFWPYRAMIKKTQDNPVSSDRHASLERISPSTDFGGDWNEKIMNCCSYNVTYYSNITAYLITFQIFVAHQGSRIWSAIKPRSIGQRSSRLRLLLFPNYPITWAAQSSQPIDVFRPGKIIWLINQCSTHTWGS